jgi:hypothetical protein
MPPARIALALLAGFAMLACAGELRADDKIWTALVLGTREDPPKPPPKALEPFAGGLESVFGYNSFYLLGEKKKRVIKGAGEWVVPRKEIFLRLRCTDRDATSYTVAIELYVKNKLIVTSEVKLARDAPLYIRGPQWGRGQLIFILEVR